ncbi:MAG: hypothetical protein A2808_01675 [Candidatus Moranbacteria bacterium RIFCSPHIGHO2_01_FULL_55_24]|nr:MAG: hypothetical protein A2808_01675 [Candidatus Moranbacteria bacterium RIFCSPHIGHO2_01_FULL_55_24]
MDSLRPTKKPEPRFLEESAEKSVIRQPEPERESPSRQPERLFHWKRIFFSLLAALALGTFIFLAFFLWKGITTGKKIQIENRSAASFWTELKGLAKNFGSGERVSLKQDENGRINILLLGRAGEKYPGRNLTDTVMLMSIDTEKRKVALLSLPRDLYTEIPGTGTYTKINALYQYGLSASRSTAPIEEAVETITGQPIHYFFILDFDGFEKAIDSLGGIEVDVVKDFYDTRYPGKNYSYETFELKRGWQTLDGATALKYVRERHDDPDGDFGRARRQQQVLQAMKNKAFSLGTFLNAGTLNSLLDTLGDSVKTDASLAELESLLFLSRSVDTRNIETVVIDAWKKESLLRVSHVEWNGVRAFVLVPRIGNWSEIRDRSEHIFEQEAFAKRKSEIEREDPQVVLLVSGRDFPAAERLKRLFQDETGIRSIRIQVGTLDRWPEQSIIVDRSSLGKPWSLDELMKKLPLAKKDSLPGGLPLDRSSDFVILVGNALAREVPEDAFGSLDDTNEALFEAPLLPAL